MKPKNEIFIVGINGSPHKSGICVKLLKNCLDQSKREGAKTKLIHLLDYEKHFFRGRYTTRADKGVGPLMGLMKEADGIILASPVYWANVSALMKNFIDQLTSLELQNFELEGKVAGFIVTEEEGGGWQTALDMAGPLNQMGLLIPPHALVFYNRKLAKKSERGWMTKDARLLGQNVVKLVKLTKTEDEYYWDYSELK